MLDAWNDFYVMVGGAAAALTGLVLVAVSLHAKAILGHPLYRDRALASLQGLVTGLLVAVAALTPQSRSAFGIELLVLGLLWIVRYVSFVGLFRGARVQHRTALQPREWALWGGWVLVLPISGAMSLVGDAAASYLLAGWFAFGIILIVRNVWVLMADVAD